MGTHGFGGADGGSHPIKACIGEAAAGSGGLGGRNLWPAASQAERKGEIPPCGLWLSEGYP